VKSRFITKDRWLADHPGATLVGSNGNAECATLYDTRSAAAGWLIAARDFCERPSIGCDGVAESLAIDELAFAAAGDEFGLAENLEMVRDSGGGDAAHRDDVATAYSVGC
jgi:hypothetical protein